MPEREAAAPRIALLLPVALLLHQLEEWFAGFPAWTDAILGNGVSPERFVAINAVGLFLITAGTWVAWRAPAAAWLAVAFATLLAVNGVVHGLATLGWARYSPGTVTGLLVSLPLGLAVLRASARRLSGGALGGGILFGILIHAAVTTIALA
jgi:hypothetical protein